MPHADHKVTINRPAAEIFDFLADGRNNARWRRGVADVELARGDGTSAGSLWRQGMRGPFGRRIDADYEITEYVPGRRLAFRVTAGPARPSGGYDLEPRGDGATEVRFALDWQPTGARRLMAPMVGRQMPKEVAQLDELKRTLESPA